MTRLVELRQLHFHLRFILVCGGFANHHVGVQFDWVCPVSTNCLNEGHFAGLVWTAPHPMVACLTPHVSGMQLGLKDSSRDYR